LCIQSRCSALLVYMHLFLEQSIPENACIDVAIVSWTILHVSLLMLLFSWSACICISSGMSYVASLEEMLVLWMYEYSSSATPRASLRSWLVSHYAMSAV
jgi:hypothetical protein